MLNILVMVLMRLLSGGMRITFEMFGLFSKMYGGRKVFWDLEYGILDGLVYWL